MTTAANRPVRGLQFQSDVLDVENPPRQRSPNKPDAAKPAVASLVHAERHWRRVAGPERSAAMLP
jgi:hypothetical protein